MAIITKRANQQNDSGNINVKFDTSVNPQTGSIESQPNYNANIKAQVFWTGIYTGGTPTSGGNPIKRDVYVTFRGITIPQGANITSAVLSITHEKQGGTPFILQANVVNAQDVSIGSPSTYTNAVTIYQRFMQRTTGTAPFLLTTPTGTKREKVVFTKVNAGPTPTGWPNVTTHDLDVKDMVQRLVNAFFYVNDKMFFQITGDFPNSSQSTGTDLYAQIYTHYMYTGAFSPKVTTATSQGTSIMTPKLVIDFAAQEPNAKLFTLDAILTAQEPNSKLFTVDAILTIDSFLRSCIEVDAVLDQGVIVQNLEFTVDTFVSPDDPGGDFEVAEAILDYLSLNDERTGFQLLQEVINPVTGNPYKNHAIKNAIGYLNGEGLITGVPYVPPPSETGAYNFKKTTWAIV